MHKNLHLKTLVALVQIGSLESCELTINIDGVVLMGTLLTKNEYLYLNPVYRQIDSQLEKSLSSYDFNKVQENILYLGDVYVLIGGTDKSVPPLPHAKSMQVDIDKISAFSTDGLF